MKVFDAEKWPRKVRSPAGKCGYCKRPVFKTFNSEKSLCRSPAYFDDDHTKDHVLPRSRGGAGSKTIKACYRCNFEKADQLLEEWLPNAWFKKLKEEVQK